MTRTQIRSLLLCISVSLSLGVFLVVFWGLAPLPEPEATATHSRGPANLDGEIERRTVAMEDFQGLWDLPLRRPVYDPPPQVVVRETPKPPPLTIRLVGTIIEPDNRQAIIIHQGREMGFYRVGQTVEQAKIIAIDTNSMEIEYFGERQTLTVVEQR